jgi:hypothetical protein
VEVASVVEEAKDEEVSVAEDEETPVVENASPVVENASPVVETAPPTVTQVSPIINLPESTDFPKISQKYEFTSLPNLSDSPIFPREPVNEQNKPDTSSDQLFEDLFGSTNSLLSTQPITTVEPIFPVVDEKMETKKNKKNKKRNQDLDF